MIKIYKMSSDRVTITAVSNIKHYVILNLYQHNCEDIYSWDTPIFGKYVFLW